MENPALGGASCQLGGDRQHPTRPTDNLQGTLDRALRHKWRAEWLGTVLALRLDQRRLLVLGAGTLHGLKPELAEELAETFLHDLQYPAAAEREAERQRRQWADHCARTWRARP